MTNLGRSLFLATQVMDLGLPVALVLNMKDLAATKGISVNTFKLYKSLGIPIIQTNARGNDGLQAVLQILNENSFEKSTFLSREVSLIPESLAVSLRERFSLTNDYQAYQIARFALHDRVLSKEDKAFVEQAIATAKYDTLEAQQKEYAISPQAN